MKKMIRYVLFVAAALLLLIILKTIVAPYFQARSEHSELTEVGPKISVLIMDVPNQTPQELRQHVEDGKAFVLLWVEKKEETSSMYTFNTMESLIRLEENKVGLLDITDPAFKNLCLARYDSEKRTLFYSKMTKEKVMVIEVNRDYLIGEILSDSSNLKKSAGEVVFSDGQRRELRIIKMPQSMMVDADLKALPQINVLNQ